MMSNRLLLICLLVVVLIAVLPAAAQGGAVGWRVESAERITIEGVSLTNLFPAPDGEQVAYQRQGETGRALCAYALATEAETCLPLPEDFPEGLSLADDLYLPALAWAPDAARIAATGRPGEGRGLWLADFAAGTVEALIEDGVVQMPAWSAGGTQIAFVQVTPDAAEMASVAVAVYDLQSGALRDVFTLPGADVYPPDPGQVRGLAWSPDGTTLAVSVIHMQSSGAAYYDAEYDGLWLVDLESGDAAQAVPPTAVQEVLDAANLAQSADGSGVPLIALAPLHWSPDGAQLLFWVGNAYMGTPGAPFGTEWLGWTDTENGAVMLLEAPGVPLPLAEDAYVPAAYQAAWSPDGSALLAAVGRWSPGSFMDYDPARDPLAAEPFMALDPDYAVEGADDYADDRIGLYVIDPLTGQGALLGHLPQVFSPPHFAAWGQGGQVIVGGYHLTLAAEG